MQKENVEQFDEIANTIRKTNKKWIQQNYNCKKNIDELTYLEEFLSDVGCFSCGRDFIVCDKRVFSLQVVCTSLELTMGSIISCCENGCIADANSLLRKYRDDMFFYLYILVYDSNKKMKHTPSINQKMEKTISSWMKNELKNFTISQLLQAIANSDYLKSTIEKYNLKQSFDEIGKQLNNYVHSNGYIYYNQQVFTYPSEKLAIELSEVVRNAKYITIVFLLLLTLCAPHLIMSDDYIDYLDFNETPPEGSQYWVAPFISKFIKENITLIDENCLEYLKNNTEMQFDL